MLRDEMYKIWAPESSVWSAWVKPVLFSHMVADIATEPLVEVDVDGISRADGSVAMVLDLPGALGVWVGVALAGRGYRPVPLYNACPEVVDESSMVPVRPIMAALIASAARLERAKLQSGAPPVFLLDYQRRSQTVPPQPGVLDNRSISLPTDFPSANLLAAAGIKTVLLVVQDETDQPQADLAHTLLRWQEAGIRITLKRLMDPAPPREIHVRRPDDFRSLWHNLLAALGMKTSPLGGFGALLPFPSSG